MGARVVPWSVPSGMHRTQGPCESSAWTATANTVSVPLPAHGTLLMLTDQDAQGDGRTERRHG